MMITIQSAIYPRLGSGIVLGVLLAAPCALAHGQNLPAVTSSAVSQGFQLPTTPGTLTFAFNLNESIRTGFFGLGASNGVGYATTISGDVAYLSGNVIHPFSMVYDGGYIYVSSGQPSSFFHNLSLSQSFNTKNWTFGVTDSLRYLPDSPISGLSGVPGLGNLGLQPPTGILAGQNPLSLFGQRITNTTIGTVDRRLTASTTLQFAGGYDILRFIKSPNSTAFFGLGFGLDSDQVSAQGGVDHRINAISNIGSSYTYSKFTFPSIWFSFETHGVNVNYARHFNRRLSMDASAGPQFITTFTQSPNLSNPPVLTSALNYTAHLNFTYLFETSTVNVIYIHGVRSGAGVFQGTIADTASATWNRSLGELSHLTAVATYVDNRSVPGLTLTFSSNTFLFDLQGSRAIGRNLSAHATYSIQNQSISGQATTFNAFSGLSQTGSIGITYSPQPIHVGHP